MNPLHPHGTARLRLGDSGKAPRFPVELVKAAREHDLGEEAVYLAWELARQAAGLTPAEHRALTLLALASIVNARQGSTRLPVSGQEGLSHLDELFRNLRGGDAELACAREMLSELRQAKLAGGTARLDAVAGLPGDYKPLILDGYALYHQRMLHAEDRLVASLRPRLAQPRLPLPEGAIAGALAELGARPSVQRGREVLLSDEQKRAVEAALTAPLTVISGGPGTGKTSIVASILRVLARVGVPLETVALAAPTGKAAWRMRQSIARSLESIRQPAPADQGIAVPEPRTLHRLLGYSASPGRSGDRFMHHAHNRLSERLVIVDEGSMIDLHLMDRLVRSMRDDARLVLLGDADQLPSVEAGAVFRDLLPPDPAPAGDPRARAAVRLTQSYRMSPDEPAGRNILSVARHVQAGRSAALFDPTEPESVIERDSAAALVFERVERTSDRAGFLDRWLSERVRGLLHLDRLTRKVYHAGPDGFGESERAELRALFDHFESFRLLCLTRGEGPGGAATFNALIHQRVLELARAHGDADLLRSAPAFWPGEPILMLENDYDRGLFNGDQGLVLRVSEGGAPHHFMAVFPRADAGFGVFYLDSLRGVIQHAFAMTVHKSQGSEFDHVGLVLPDDDLPLNTRELLYTAITRSRHSVVILGPRDLLLRGIDRRIRRFSGLAGKLGSP